MSEKMQRAFRETKILNDQIIKLEKLQKEQKEKRKGYLHVAKSMIRSKDKYKATISKMDDCFFCSKKAKECHHLLKVSDQAWNSHYENKHNLIPVCQTCHNACHSKDKHHFTSKNPTEAPHLNSLFKQTIMWLAINMSATENSWEDKLKYHWKYQYIMGQIDIQQICFPYFARRQSEVYVLFAPDYQAKALIGETKHKVHVLINDGRLFELFESWDSPFPADHPIYDPNLKAEWITTKPIYGG